MSFLKAWFEAPFRLILTIMEIYKANTDRVTRLMGQSKVRRLLNGAVLLTVLLWLVVFVFLGEERRGDRTRAVRELLPFEAE